MARSCTVDQLAGCTRYTPLRTYDPDVAYVTSFSGYLTHRLTGGLKIISPTILVSGRWIIRPGME